MRSTSWRVWGASGLPSRRPPSSSATSPRLPRELEMKAILARPSGGFGLCEGATPSSGPGEILVEMRACGLCGTDLAKLSQPKISSGAILGHELAGVVRHVGQL